jgi:hypothetical protein
LVVLAVYVLEVLSSDIGWQTSIMTQSSVAFSVLQYVKTFSSLVLNNKTRKDTQIHIYIAVVVPILTWIQSFDLKNQEAKTRTSEMKFFKIVAGYIRKGHISNTTVREEMNICNQSNKILKS